MADRVQINQSHAQKSSQFKTSWGTFEASFINTLCCVKMVRLWQVVQGKCDNGDTVSQCSMTSKSLISFSVYLKQFDMNTKTTTTIKKKTGLA